MTVSEIKNIDLPNLFLSNTARGFLNLAKGFSQNDQNLDIGLVSNLLVLEPQSNLAIFTFRYDFVFYNRDILLLDNTFNKSYHLNMHKPEFEEELYKCFTDYYNNRIKYECIEHITKDDANKILELIKSKNLTLAHQLHNSLL